MAQMSPFVMGQDIFDGMVKYLSHKDHLNDHFTFARCDRCGDYMGNGEPGLEGMLVGDKPFFVIPHK